MKKIQHLEEDGEHYILDCETGEYINPITESPHDAYIAVCAAGGIAACDNVETIPDDEDADSFFANAKIVEEKTV